MSNQLCLDCKVQHVECDNILFHPHSDTYLALSKSCNLCKYHHHCWKVNRMLNHSPTPTTLSIEVITKQEYCDLPLVLLNQGKCISFVLGTLAIYKLLLWWSSDYDKWCFLDVLLVMWKDFVSFLLEFSFQSVCLRQFVVNIPYLVKPTC